MIVKHLKETIDEVQEDLRTAPVYDKPKLRKELKYWKDRLGRRLQAIRRGEVTE